MWRTFDSKKSCSVLGSKQPVLDFRLPLDVTHPNTGLLLKHTHTHTHTKKKLHSEKSLYSGSVGHPSSPMVLCLAHCPPGRLLPQGPGTGCSLCLKCSPQISTWPTHSSRLNLWDFPGGPVVKYPPCKARDVSLILGWGTKIPHEETGAPHRQIDIVF